MFYTCSDTANAVAIVQKIGRISGTSRDDIYERRLYTQENTYEVYCGYIANQETIIEVVKSPENSERLVEDILKETIPGVVDIKRPLDRKVLKNTNAKYLEAAPIASSSGSSSSETDDANDIEKRKKDVTKWINPRTITNIAQMFRKIYYSDQHRLLSSEVIRILLENDVDSTNHNNMVSATHSSRWFLVFAKDDTHHYITPEAVAFADTL